jgi:hypothetical protein
MNSKKGGNFSINLNPQRRGDGPPFGKRQTAILHISNKISPVAITPLYDACEAEVGHLDELTKRLVELGIVGEC